MVYVICHLSPLISESLLPVITAIWILAQSPAFHISVDTYIVDNTVKIFLLHRRKLLRADKLRELLMRLHTVYLTERTYECGNIATIYLLLLATVFLILLFFSK